MNAVTRRLSIVNPHRIASRMLKLMITSPNELALGAFRHYCPYDMQIAHYTRRIILMRIMRHVCASTLQNTVCTKHRS